MRAEWCHKLKGGAVEVDHREGEGGRARGVGGAVEHGRVRFEGRGREVGGVIGPGAVGGILLGEFGGPKMVAPNEGVLVLMLESIHVPHHASGSVDDGEVVTQQFLGPAADLGDFAIVVEDLFHGRAVSNKIKVGAPQIFAALFDAPSRSGDFANKAVEGLFIGFAGSGAKPHGSEAWAVQDGVEVTDAGAEELGGGFGGDGGGLGLHEDEAHAKFAPVGFEEHWLGAVIAGKTGTGGDGSF